MAKAQIVAASEAMPVSDGEIPREKPADKYEPLMRWVMSRCEQWRSWRDSAYMAKWDEYERLWRGLWSSNERLRDSERSKIVTPALSEAVENAAAELEEAVFGRGTDYFDVTPYSLPRGAAQAAPGMPGMGQPPPQMAPMGPMPPQMGPMPPQMGPMPPQMGPMEPPPDPEQALRRAVDKVRESLREDLARSDFAANASKCILNAAVYGSGFGEIVLTEKTFKTPKTDYELDVVHAESEKVTIARLRPIHPRNFLYDTVAESLDDALGVAVEEVVSKHVILKAQKEGNYRKDIELCHSFEDDSTLYGDQADYAPQPEGDKVHQLRYYGLVPLRLLEARDSDDGGAQDTHEISDDDELVEACVVIINKGTVAKAIRNPYTMQDRPVVAFPWDVVPGRLMGRGICEKGASSQKILDAEVRARLDSLALVSAPMLGVDANRVPRGAKLEVRPGRTILTNGNPAEVMVPFKFGQLDPNHWQNYESLKSMVQQATGSLDAAALAGNAGNARSGAMSMALAPIIKRYKRTLVHFLDLFLMPALEKITWRHMQYQRERYPAVPLKFKAASTMGIMQREYETSQLTALLQSLDPTTAEHRAVLVGIVSNTSIPNREQVLEMIEAGEDRERIALAMAAMQQQDPMAQQLQQVSIELEIAEKQAKIRELNSQAELNEAKARETAQSAEIEALSIATKGIYAVPEEQQAAEFDRRYKMAQLALKQADIEEKRADRNSNERITDKQMRMSLVRDQIKASTDMRKQAMAQRAKQSQQSAAVE